MDILVTCLNVFVVLDKRRVTLSTGDVKVQVTLSFDKNEACPYVIGKQYAVSVQPLGYDASAKETAGIQPTKCPACNGTGRVFGTCPRCGGSGLPE